MPAGPLIGDGRRCADIYICPKRAHRPHAHATMCNVLAIIHVMERTHPHKISPAGGRNGTAWQQQRKSNCTGFEPHLGLLILARAGVSKLDNLVDTGQIRQRPCPAWCGSLLPCCPAAPCSACCPAVSQSRSEQAFSPFERQRRTLFVLSYPLLALPSLSAITHPAAPTTATTRVLHSGRSGCSKSPLFLLYSDRNRKKAAFGFDLFRSCIPRQNSQPPPSQQPASGQPPPRKDGRRQNLHKTTAVLLYSVQPALSPAHAQCPLTRGRPLTRS